MDDSKVVQSIAVDHSRQFGGQDKLDSPLKRSAAQEKEGRPRDP